MPRTRQRGHRTIHLDSISAIAHPTWLPQRIVQSGPCLLITFTLIEERCQKRTSQSKNYLSKSVQPYVCFPKPYIWLNAFHKYHRRIFTLMKSVQPYVCFPKAYIKFLNRTFKWTVLETVHILSLKLRLSKASVQTIAMPTTGGVHKGYDCGSRYEHAANALRQNKLHNGNYEDQSR
jgi:hypothetical protein